MAKTKRTADLDSWNKRKRLEVGKEHVSTLSEGCYLIYRRPKNGANGTWQARWRDPKTGDWSPRHKLGAADDVLKADGIAVLTWEQVKAKSGEWFQAQARRAHLLATGQHIPDGPLTVRHAVDGLKADIRRRGRPGETVESYARTRILPVFGDVEIENLTRKRIMDWHEAIANSPRWKTGQKFSAAQEAWEADPTDEQKRARKNTANRILAVLKKALNLLVDEGTWLGATPWRDVKPFLGVSVARPRFLTPDEQRRLVDACAPDFQCMVIAALHTGSRYGPLCRLRVRDFSPDSATVYIARDKGKGKDTARHVHLSPRGVKWFKAQVKGKSPNDLVFTRASSKRTLRKDAEDSWSPSDQALPMKLACKAAGIEPPITFHGLRHTYASDLVRNGAHLKYVAEQLGHVDTRMCEKFYTHLAKDALAETIREKGPKILPRKAGAIRKAPR